MRVQQEMANDLERQKEKLEEERRRQEESLAQLRLEQEKQKEELAEAQKEKAKLEENSAGVQKELAVASVVPQAALVDGQAGQSGKDEKADEGGWQRCR